jgi:DHA2 family multidrug resistance protein-like MFS transporter
MQTATTDTDAHAAALTPDGLPTPRRYWSAATIWLAMAMSVLDGAIANVALPTIARELNALPAASIWIVNAYQLAITVTLLPLAALGDKLGYRRVYMAGLAVFTIGSLGCALSHSLTQLIAARILQGMGAAGIMSINAALVRFTFPRRVLGSAIGLNWSSRSRRRSARPSLRRSWRSPRGNGCSRSTCRSGWWRSSSPRGPCRAPRAPAGGSISSPRG